MVRFILATVDIRDMVDSARNAHFNELPAGTRGKVFRQVESTGVYALGYLLQIRMLREASVAIIRIKNFHVQKEKDETTVVG